tara:strand:- start:1685 stop:1999 length:315 start_codon:yes stop_codon:yes gene_type:complete
MTKFCFHCGTKLEYKFKPPNFCTNCGESTSGEKKTEAKHIPQNAEIALKEDADGYTNATSIPHIYKLEYEIEDFGSNLQQTIGSIGGQQAPKRRQRSIRDMNNL